MRGTKHKKVRKIDQKNYFCGAVKKPLNVTFKTLTKYTF